MIYVALLLISFSGFAQSVYSPENLQPVPHLEQKELFTMLQEQPTRVVEDKKLKGEATAVGRNLSVHFASIASHLTPPPSTCDSIAAVQYTEALRQAGQFQNAQNFLQNCEKSGATVHQGVYLFAALSTADLNQHARADQIFTAGLKSTSSEYFDLLVYQYASFAKFGIYPGKTGNILSQHPQWKEKVNTVDGLLEYAAFGRTSKASVAAIEDFLLAEMKSTNNLTRAFFLNVKLVTLTRQYKYTEAKNFLVQYSVQMTQPQAALNPAYSTFYAQSPSTYSYAREIYDQALPYLHADSVLPLEQNTYNYTELYRTVCKDNLLQNSDYESFMRIRNSWKEGNLGYTQAIAQLEQLNQAKPNRADLLTTLGGLYRLTGNSHLAKEKYWEAHQACAYYNRAHWGLRLLTRKALYESYPEYQSIENKVARLADSVPWPSHPQLYFLNWAQFNSAIHQHIIYGARIWLSQIPYLVRNDLETYLKFDFELLSESPNLARMRDQRIGGANYPNDNRLWDDVRGLGGGTVVADIWETYHTPHGDYNLLGHEMSHQLQRAAEMNSEASAANIVECITNLYTEARQKNNFPDAYSSQNKEEHFAQGVTYYLVPQDSPPRFGLNQGWVERNNPRQFRFIQSIEKSDGQLQKISCL